MDAEKKDEELAEYLKRYGLENQEGFVDAITGAATELAKEWGLAPTQLHEITGFDWASDVAELADKHRERGVRIQNAALDMGETGQNFDPPIPPKPIELPKYEAHREKWRKTWGIIQSYVIQNHMTSAEIASKIKDSPILKDRLRDCPTSRDTLYKIIEAGKAGLL